MTDAHQTLFKGLDPLRPSETPWRFEIDPKDAAVYKGAASLMLKGRAKYVSPWEVEAQWVPYCDDPVPVYTATGRGVKPMAIALRAPCRKCVKCGQFKQMKWQERIINEVVMTEAEGRRTWFMTLTISPVHMAGIIAEAKAKFGRVTPVTIDKAAYPHVKLYLDRIRKRLKTRFRYIAVLERGEESGRSHYHLLVHETGPNPLLYRAMDQEWRSFTAVKLLSPDDAKEVRKAARYVSTYATKTLGTRIRASIAYGTRAASKKRNLFQTSTPA